jgi:hypothetical protein
MLQGVAVLSLGDRTRYRNISQSTEARITVCVMKVKTEDLPNPDKSVVSPKPPTTPPQYPFYLVSAGVMQL